MKLIVIQKCQQLIKDRIELNVLLNLVIQQLLQIFISTHIYIFISLSLQVNPQLIDLECIWEFQEFLKILIWCAIL